MTSTEIEQQIDLLSQQVQQRANAIASQDPLISRLTGQIEVYRAFLQSDITPTLDIHEETESA